MEPGNPQLVFIHTNGVWRGEVDYQVRSSIHVWYYKSTVLTPVSEFCAVVC
jgi:hypothetical protein